MQTSKDLVVVLPNWIGDAVMATPMLRALRRTFTPEHRIVGVMKPYVAAVFEGEPWFDEIVLHDRDGRRGGLKLGALIHHFRASRPDTMIVMASSWRFGWLALLSGARRRIGYRRNFRGWMLTHAIPFSYTRDDGSTLSVVEQYLELAYAVGCAAEPTNCELHVTAEDEAGADLIWNNLGFGGRDRVVALNPGNTNGQARNWSGEKFVALARRVVDMAPDLRVLFLCGPAEREVASRLASEAAHPRIVSMADQDMRLGVTKAVLRRAHVLVTGDHGLRHIAGGFETPTVCLEGPMNGEQTNNGNPLETRVRLGLSCQPCHKRDCPLGHNRCMVDLSLDMVLPAVVRALSPRPLLHVA